MSFTRYFHMLFMDGMYARGLDGAMPFRWVKAIYLAAGTYRKCGA